jgi:formate dehydrogenase iron-sulfur subunit
MPFAELFPLGQPGPTSLLRDIAPTHVETPVPLGPTENALGKFSWLMMSDVCKHCERAGCLEACPTGAILRTEIGSVYIQPDVCNGCGYCVSACPFGVVARREDDGRAWKCTLCYDRQKGGMIPACAKACPTASIQFGELGESPPARRPVPPRRSSSASSGSSARAPRSASRSCAGVA